MPSRRSLLIATALLSVYVLQCVWSASAESITFDESIHTFVGMENWRQHRFDRWVETPPLGRLLLTLPIVSNRFQMEVLNPDGWLLVTAIRPGPGSLIAEPRAVNIAFGLILGILLWCVVRRLFSEEAACFALALFAFSPPVIAHFSLATIDGIGALMVFALAFQLVRWRENPSQGQTLLTGLVFGLALLAKLYTPPYVGLALLLMLLTPSGRQRGATEAPRFALSPRTWSWKPALTALGIAFLLVWAGYFFHVGYARLHNGQLTITYPERTLVLGTSNHWNLDFAVPVPAPKFIAGLHEAALHNELGHPSFLLGKVYRSGAPHTFFPIAIVLKWPTIPLLLALAGLVLLVAGRLPRLAVAEVLVVAGAGALALILAMSARLGIGDRHVLPAYPFLLVLAAAVWHWASGLTAGRRKVIVGLALLVLLNAADALRYAPGYLSYFNVFVAPARSYLLLTDSSLDWGQGLLKLREYQQQHPDALIHLAYFGSVDPRVYGIKAVPLYPNRRVPGTVVVSATLLSGQYLQDPASYRWVLQYQPKAILDHSMFVFEIPQN